MPNHITNYVEIKGSKEQIANLIKRTLREEDGKTIFDLNGIIPMPPSLDIETGSNLSLGLAAFIQDKFDEYSRYGWFPERFPGVKTMTELHGFMKGSQDKTLTKSLALGAAGYENLQRYGYPSWYKWRVEKWGTKWNAYDTSVLKQEPSRLVITFETAWSPPEPIFDQLVSEGFEVNCLWQDEDPSNYGEYGDPWQTFYRSAAIGFAG